jgi:hypothetical protein
MEKNEDTISSINENQSNEDLFKIMNLGKILNNKILDMTVPFYKRILDLRFKEIYKFIDTLDSKSESSLLDYFTGLSKRATSGFRYERLVNTLGKELLGTAKFNGEKLLGENEYYTFTYIPPDKSKENIFNLFHVGGMLPYSDKVFRLLPEMNFYKPFINSGIGIYALELKGSDETNDKLSNFTISEMLKSIYQFSDIAFEHNGNRKMVIEGYCGLGMPVVASYLVDAKNMEKKFSVIALFVTPINGKNSPNLSYMINSFPKRMPLISDIIEYLDSNNKTTQYNKSLDFALGSLLDKTFLGRVMQGWQSEKFADINSIDELDLIGKLELAGAYWISPESGKRFPMTKDIMEFSRLFFVEGIDEKGLIPYKFNNKHLNLNDFKKLDTKIISFYGDKDHVIDTHCGDILEKILPEQYTHVTHKDTGHVAYIFNNERWDKDNRRAFDPNIIETIKKAYLKK